MANDLFSLARDIGVLQQELPQHVSRMTKDIAIGTVSALIRITPVDTSKAESNWQISLGGAGVSEIPAHIPGSRGSTAGESAAIAESYAHEKIDGRLPGQSIHVINVVDYIEDLAEGSSPQMSKGGFARRAEMVIDTMLDGYRLL